MDGSSDSCRVALFLDVENLVIEAQKAALVFAIERLLDFAREAGVLSFARGYADWSSASMVPLVKQFQSNAVQMEQLSTARGKNTADLQLSLDALEMCLQPHAPDIVIVAGGDRDFVPLVQKLRRYGIRVVGVGVEGASSKCLAQVCDEYVYYDTLVPAEADDHVDSPSEAGKAGRAADPADAAFNVLVRAIQAQDRAGHTVKGAGARTVMQRLDPTFDPGRLGFGGFKEFVLAAEAAGYIEVTQPPGTDMQLAAKVSPLISVPLLASEGETAFSYDSDAAAVESYRRILAERKNVPLIPWAEREHLVRCLWEELSRTPEGLAVREMNEFLQRSAETSGFQRPARALQKLTQTLSIAGCFVRSGKQGSEREMTSNRHQARADADTALGSMHTTYLVGILGVDPSAKLLPVAVSGLLFDDHTKEHVTLARKLIAEATAKAGAPETH